MGYTFSKLHPSPPVLAYSDPIMLLFFDYSHCWSHARTDPPCIPCCIQLKTRRLYNCS